MTQTDVFTRQDWNSNDVEIVGVHLGMSRYDANAAVRRFGFQLVENEPPSPGLFPCSRSSLCVLSSGSNVDDLNIAFGNKGEVVEVELAVRFPEARGRLLRSLKGRTLEFLAGTYTDALRQELFGKETAQILLDGRWGAKWKDTRYVYADRGITITVSLRQPTTDPVPEVVAFDLVPAPMRDLGVIAPVFY
jgi:hypothetical protein